MRSKYKFKSGKIFLFLIVLILFIIFISLLFVNNKFNITIPAIFLNDAPIKEGIEQGVLNEYIGHFPTTSNLDGNVGLAAHNRGYNKNYFSKLHDIKMGDEIIYKMGDNIRKYKVDKKVEIDSYDWSYLNQTNDNRITLITCIDNEPSKRLVVQAVE